MNYKDAIMKQFLPETTDLLENSTRPAKPPDSGTTISLSYRPPFDYEGLIKSYKNHRIGNLEWFENEKMHRVVFFDGKLGQIAISNDPENCSIIVEIDFPDRSMFHKITTGVRNLFDLDSDPSIVAK